MESVQGIHVLDIPDTKLLDIVKVLVHAQKKQKKEKWLKKHVINCVNANAYVENDAWNIIALYVRNYF